MSPPSLLGHHLGVEITIRIETRGALSGKVIVGDDQQQDDFEGWLQLLKLLSDAVATAGVDLTR